MRMGPAPISCDGIACCGAVIPSWHPSPNFGTRKNGARPDLVVIHYTAMDSAKAALERLCDPAFEVSAHYLIGQDGHVWQMVDEDARAWHAGQGRWGPFEDVNSASIGIELCNLGNHPFPQVQIEALCALLQDIQARHGIAPQRVIGHSDMAPDRKQDPGPMFPWDTLAAQGVAISGPSEDTAAVMLPFFEAARRFGYPTELGTDHVINAFRSRFRPNAVGPLCDADRVLMARLAAAYPVDASARAV
ncbi:MAG: N-acetylmuramoyl-L-alanine amidase [Planktomarina sp.]